MNMFTLDRSISKVLDELGYTLQDLGLKGCTLFYRRRDIDMPLSPLPTDTAEQLGKSSGSAQEDNGQFLKEISVSLRALLGARR